MAKKGIAKNRRKLVERYGLVCQGCKKNFPNDQLTVDHIRPLSKGGHPRALGNLQLMCEPCNLEKGDSWDCVSGLGIDDCNLKRMSPEKQAMICLQEAMDDVAVAVLKSKGDYSMPELVAIGVAAAVSVIPRGYADNSELADSVRSSNWASSLFGSAIEKNDPLLNGE